MAYFGGPQFLVQNNYKEKSCSFGVHCVLIYSTSFILCAVRVLTQ